MTEQLILASLVIAFVCVAAVLYESSKVAAQEKKTQERHDTALRSIENFDRELMNSVQIEDK